MNFIIRLLLVSVFGVRLLATEEYIKLPARDFAGWNILSAEPHELVAEGRLTIPAGVQLSRTFSGNAAILHAVTQLRFSADAAEWPILAVGPAALTLVRRGGEGRVILVLNETTVTELPWVVPLDADGRAGVDLTLAIDSLSGEGVVAYKDQLQSFQISAAGRSLELFFANGSIGSWSFDLAEMLVFSADSQAQNAASESHGESLAERIRTKDLASLAKQLEQNGRGVFTNRAESTPILGVEVSGRQSTLEIFTPPSVRRGLIVAAVAKATGVNVK